MTTKLDLREAPLHRRRSPKRKLWRFELEFTGERLDDDPFGNLFKRPWVQRYETERAARQAYDAWFRARGNWQWIFRREDGWVGKVAGPNDHFDPCI